MLAFGAGRRGQIARRLDPPRVAKLPQSCNKNANNAGYFLIIAEHKVSMMELQSGKRRIGFGDRVAYVLLLMALVIATATWARSDTGSSGASAFPQNA